MAAKVKVTIDQDGINRIGFNATRGLFKMGFLIAQKARANAPHLTGALRNSIQLRTADGGGTILITAGSSRVPYARRREYENKAHPWTTHYMGRAYSAVVKPGGEKEYFGDLTRK